VLHDGKGTLGGLLTVLPGAKRHGTAARRVILVPTTVKQALNEPLILVASTQHIHIPLTAIDCSRPAVLQQWPPTCGTRNPGGMGTQIATT
jgi:hypothetical protein